MVLTLMCYLVRGVGFAFGVLLIGLAFVAWLLVWTIEAITRKSLFLK